MYCVCIVDVLQMSVKFQFLYTRLSSFIGITRKDMACHFMFECLLLVIHSLQKQDCCFDHGLVTRRCVLNKHTICYSRNKHILHGVTDPFLEESQYVSSRSHTSIIHTLHTISNQSVVKTAFEVLLLLVLLLGIIMYTQEIPSCRNKALLIIYIYKCTGNEHCRLVALR